LILAVKLFALMGGTWMMEFISWLAKDDHVVWMFFDMLNILRGPFYFYFCVVGNKKVREALIRRFWPGYFTRNNSIEVQETQKSEVSI